MMMAPDGNCVLPLSDDMLTNGSLAPTGSPNDTSATDLGGLQNYNTATTTNTYRPSTNGNSAAKPAGYSANSNAFYPGAPSGGGGGNLYPVSVTSTATGESGGGGGSRMVVAPPPTPLDSRSHFSGLSSSGNSASAYSRSLISGASNSTGTAAGGGGAGVYAVHGVGGNGGPQGYHHHPGDLIGGGYNHRMD